MSELAPQSSTKESRVQRFFSSGDSYLELTKDLDRAIQRKDHGVARALSPLLTEIEERRGISLSLAKAYLLGNGLPLAEGLDTLRNGREIDEITNKELDLTYEDTAEHIAVLLREREALPAPATRYANKMRNEIIGGITELSMFALLNRNGRYLNLLALPTTDNEDILTYDRAGRGRGIDFNVYPLNPMQDLENPVRLQVKTSSMLSNRAYQDDILVVGLSSVTPQPSQALLKLPEAIVAEARETSTPAQRFIVGRTAINLSMRIWNHYIQQQQ